MAVPVLTPAQLQAFTDQELFSLLPATAGERYRARGTKQEEDLFEEEPERFIKTEAKAVLDELWNRHFPPQEGKLGGKLRNLCPRQHADRDGFVSNALSQAYIAFLRRIVRQEYENFRGYLYTLVLNVARDEVRKITRRPLEGGEVNRGPTLSKPREEQLDENTDAVSQGKGPLQTLTESHLKEIMRKILEEHAPDHLLSTLTLILHGVRDQTWEEVAETLQPEEIFEGSLEARKGRVRRLFKLDRVKVAPKLAKYGITSEHVFHWKEAGRVGTSESEPE